MFDTLMNEAIADTAMETNTNDAVERALALSEFIDTTRIVLKSVYGKTGHKLRLEPCFSQRTNEWLGVDKLSEEQKRLATYVVEPGKTFLTITDNHEFDLTREKDRKDWEWVRHCPQIGVNRDATNFNIRGEQAEDFTSFEGADKEFYMYSEAAELAHELSLGEEKFKAEKFVREQSVIGRNRMARLLGSNMDNTSSAEVLRFLVGKAQKHPKQLLSLANDPSTTKRLFLYSALDRNIIVKRDGVYLYGDVRLGISEEQCLLWLEDDRNYTLVRGIKNALDAKVRPLTPSKANHALFAETFAQTTTENKSKNGTSAFNNAAAGDSFLPADDDTGPSLEQLEAMQLGEPVGAETAAHLPRAQQLAAARAAKLARV